MRGRKATGCPQLIDGKWFVRVTDPVTKRRPYIPLGDQVASKEAAEVVAPIVAMKYRHGGLVKAGSPETVSEWFDRWIANREKKLSSTRNDRSRFDNHIDPVIGKLPMRSVSRSDLERLVRALDEKVQRNELSWKTAVNVWAVASKMFSDAKTTKIVELRVRPDDNPASDVEGPDRGIARAKAYLYPSEFLQLVGCEQVPRRWRHMFAVCTYLYVRRGELAALKVGDVDLAHNVVHVHSAEGENTSKAKRDRGATKTGITRRIPIEPTLQPLLAYLCHGRAKQEFLMDLPWEDQLAKGLRMYLQKAGVDREELFADDETRKPITFHDLRATGITWAAVRGDDDLKIRQRAGHTDFTTTQRYIREAENLRDIDFGEVFPKLPESLTATISSVKTSPGNFQRGYVPRIVGGYQCEGGDLNASETAGNKLFDAKVGSEQRPLAPATDEMTIDNDNDYEVQLMTMLGEVVK